MAALAVRISQRYPRQSPEWRAETHYWPYRINPVEVLRKEAGVCSYRTHRDRLAATSVEKAQRMDSDHPRRITLDKAVPKRLKRENWRSRGLQMQSRIPNIGNLDKARPQDIAHWSEAKCNWSVNTTLEGNNRIEPARASELALKLINQGDQHYTIYTDGSASEGTSDGGSAAVITTGAADNPNAFHKIRTKGRELTSSYEEEKEAMLAAAMWVASNQRAGERVLM